MNLEMELKIRERRGIELGKRLVMWAMATDMAEDNMDVAKIAKYTQLPITEIEEIKQRIEQGMDKKARDIAADMLKDNMDKEVIAKYTKLSIPEIEALAKDMGL